MIRHTLLLGQRPGEIFTKWHNEYGPILRIKDVDDPTLKEIVKFVKANSSYADFTNDISEMFPILKILEILFRRDRKTQRYIDNELFPFMRQIIKYARESGGDSLVKKINSVKEEYDIDETGVIVLMGKW